MKLKHILLLVSAFAAVPSVFSERFEFKDREGDKFRMMSKTEQEVLLDGKRLQSSSIFNRMASEVTGVSAGRARLSATFNVAEETTSDTSKARYEWGEEYVSMFSRDKFGKIEIEKKFFMPSARDLPLFPDREINPGESWISQGNEVFDLRRNFDIKEPYSVPFRANNTFAGMREWKKKKYPAITITYNLLKNNDGFESSPRTWLSSPGERSKPLNAKPEIRRITGTSRQTIYWDAALGQIAAAEDTYELNFELDTGEKWTFRGKTVSELIEAERMNKEEALREVREAIEQLDIKDVTVKKVDEGIALTLDNIQFAADSAELLPQEKIKLDKIGAILKKFNERDILVAGHTALAGSSERDRVKLSEQRALSVADYLIDKKIRTGERVMTRGYGSSKPVADNRSEAGKQKNRRVEITILEN